MAGSKLVCFINLLQWSVLPLAVSQSPGPLIETPLGKALGSYPAAGVERYGGLPYAIPPVAARRFARATVSHEPWPGGTLDASKTGPPCIQNPVGDPRSSESDSPPPSEDCLMLNIWRPAGAPAALRPVMVYLYGGGLCTGFAANEYMNGSNLVLQHDVVVVSVQYRLGALGFLYGEDPSRPGTGGMNGIHDSIVALQWLQKYVGAFGGDAADITLFGQSSGGYSTCTISVAPEAKGLLKRASLLSGPCLGGPPSRGWGPMSDELGRRVTQQVLAAHNATSLEDLRRVPAEQVQWPDEWMSDLDKAPYFSGYFVDPAVLPDSSETLWKQGAINPDELLVSFTSKDGTAAYYGTAPTLGLVPPDENTSTPQGYAEKMRAVWGPKADEVMQQYPLSAYPTASSAFLEADADAFVVCPLRQLVRHAVMAGRTTWVSEFAHFQPSIEPPTGCSGYGPLGCKGFGCDNGVELDVVARSHTEATKLWATHGADFHYIFGTERGPDGIGKPNITHCSFSPPERGLRDQMMSFWASFARHGNPQTAAAKGSPAWPPAKATDIDIDTDTDTDTGSGISSAKVSIQRMRFAVKETDGVPTSLLEGMRDVQCDFWDGLFSHAEDEEVWI